MCYWLPTDPNILCRPAMAFFQRGRCPILWQASWIHLTQPRHHLWKGTENIAFLTCILACQVLYKYFYKCMEASGYCESHPIKVSLNFLKPSKMWNDCIPSRVGIQVCVCRKIRKCGRTLMSFARLRIWRNWILLSFNHWLMSGQNIMWCTSPARWPPWRRYEYIIFFNAFICNYFTLFISLWVRIT